MGAELTYIDGNIPEMRRDQQVINVLRMNSWLNIRMRDVRPVVYKHNGDEQYPDGITATLYDKKNQMIASFSLTEMPGCPAILISHGLFVRLEHSGKGVAQALLDAKEYIAREYGYSLLMATVDQKNLPENHILAKNGWVSDKGFLNLRTGHIVLTWRKELRAE